MLKNLKRLWRGSRRARLRYAQLAELRAAVAALAQGQAAALGKPIQGVEIDGMLLHAAKARVDMERIEALYGSVAAASPPSSAASTVSLQIWPTRQRIVDKEPVCEEARG